MKEDLIKIISNYGVGNQLKKLAEEIEKVHIPDEFKFYDDEIDLMEIYEELFRRIE